MEKIQPTADCIVARLVPSWGSIISLLFKATEPYEHYYDEHGEEVPNAAIASWTDVELPPEPESEDEKIRKRIIEYISGCPLHDDSKKEFLAYLEKQKEHDGEEWIAPENYTAAMDNAYHKGVIDTLANKDAKVKDELLYAYNEGRKDAFKEYGERQKEQKPNGAIVEESFNEGDGFYRLNLAYLSKEQVEKVEKLVTSWNSKEQRPAEWSEEDDNRDDLIANAMIDEISKSDMSDISKHNRIYWINKHRQKLTEWSEKDKAFLMVAIAICNKYSHKDIADWLKSLRPQSHWKPSEGQMRALRSCVSGWLDDTEGNLTSLYNDLKKL